MALYTKCILSERSTEDGTRISVMSRHTLNDGVTPDERITNDKFDETLRLLAPSDKLVGDYYKRGLPWEEYEKSYVEFLRMPHIFYAVKSLARRALKNDITLLCIEEFPEFCHRRLLAEECKRYEPGLNIVIK